MVASGWVANAPNEASEEEARYEPDLPAPTAVAGALSFCALLGVHGGARARVLRRATGEVTARIYWIQFIRCSAIGIING